MALSNIYKAQTNKFSHLGSEDDDDDDGDDEEYYADRFDETYNKNFKALHSVSKPDERPLMQPVRSKTKIRHRHSRTWCTTKCCLATLIWIFLVVLIIGLALMAMKMVEAGQAGQSDSDVQYTKKVMPGSSGVYSDPSNTEACTKFKAEKVWHTSIPKVMTETAVRLNDVNGDGVKDIIISFATGVDAYKPPKFACDLYFNGSYPCFGGAMALDGVTGKEIWRHYTMHETYALNCNGDLDLDGTWDCLLGGRGAVFQAISGRTGKLLWNFGEQPARDTNMNVYTAQFIRDLNGDGVMEVLVAHGGDPLAEANSPERLKGRLVIFSGKTGVVLRWVVVPDEKETYFSPNVYTKKDGREMVIFGTGGESHPGGLWVIPLMNLYHGFIDTAQQIYEDKHKGVMTPPVLVDLTRDGVVDIVMSMFNTTIIAFDGESYQQIWNYTFPHCESYATPAAGLYNDDDIPDIMVRYNYGAGFPVYYYSQMTILDGNTGQPLVTPFRKTSVVANSSPLTVSMEGTGNDLFVYWMADCMGHEGEGGGFEFVEGTNVHEQSRADTCKLRYNTKGFSKLNMMNAKSGFPGKAIYYSEDYWKLEHAVEDGSGNHGDGSGNHGSRGHSQKDPTRAKRHIGVPDHGGYQRIIATGAIAPSLKTINNKGPSETIDVVFTTYWQYPAKVRVILPEDKACIEHYRKLSKQGKFNNRINSDANEKHGIYDAGDGAVNLCLKKSEQRKQQGKTRKPGDKDVFISQSDFNWYQVHFGSMTIYRFQISCDCANSLPAGKRCSRFLPMSQQGWGGYMGTLANGLYIPRNEHYKK